MSLTESSDFARELSSVYRSDMTMVCSDYDKMILQELYGCNHILCVPHFVENDSIIHAKKRLEELDLGRSYSGNLLFFGEFDKHADRVNLRFVLEEIWPKVLEVFPEMRLDVVGQYIDAEILTWCSEKTHVRTLV